MFLGILARVTVVIKYKPCIVQKASVDLAICTHLYQFCVFLGVNESRVECLLGETETDTA